MFHHFVHFGHGGGGVPFLLIIGVVLVAAALAGRRPL
jgi:hypothetical protein